MSSRWQVALDIICIEEIRSFRRPEHEFIVRSLDWLADNATQPLYMTERSSSGREVRVWVAGRFLISYWLDHGTKEVRIVRIERIKFIGKKN